jgi:hypothetical protein
MVLQQPKIPKGMVSTSHKAPQNALGAMQPDHIVKRAARGMPAQQLLHVPINMSHAP